MLGIVEANKCSQQEQAMPIHGERRGNGFSTFKSRCGVSMTCENLDPVELRRVFGAFPSGVIAIAAMVDGRPVGLAASSFTSVSLDPPLVSICVANTSSTWPALRDAPRFGVSILAADQAEVCRQLASRDADRFAGLEWRAMADGEVVLEGSSAWLHCSMYAVYQGGDHDIVVLRIHDLDVDHGIRPLVFHASKFCRLEA